MCNKGHIRRLEVRWEEGAKTGNKGEQKREIIGGPNGKVELVILILGVNWVQVLLETV